MHPILFILYQLNNYHVDIPEGTTSIQIYTHEIIFHGAEHEEEGYSGRKYLTTVLDDFEYENERISNDNYQYNFDGTYPIADVLAMQANYDEAMAMFRREQQKAIQELAEIAKGVSEGITRGLEIAKEYGVEFIVNGDDFRKLGAVDWDSSSMYC